MWYDKYDFVEFSDKEEVSFFKSIDWIIDYKEYMKSSKSRINIEYINLFEEIKNLSYHCNSMTDDEKEVNNNLVIEQDLLNYKLNSISDIIQFKSGNLQMPIPNVPDSNGLYVDYSTSAGYIFKEGLAPGTILMYKADGEPLKKDDNAYPNLINKAIFNIRKKRNDFDDEKYNYNNKYGISDDNVYLIITYRHYKSNRLDNSNKEKPKIFKNILKRFGNK